MNDDGQNTRIEAVDAPMFVPLKVAALVTALVADSPHANFNLTAHGEETGDDLHLHLG